MSSRHSFWLLLGNLYVLRGGQEQALAAYKKSSGFLPAGPLRQSVDDLVQTQPLNMVLPMRDPSME